MDDALSADTRGRLAAFRDHTGFPLSSEAEEAVWRAALTRTSRRHVPTFGKMVAFAAACAIGGFAAWTGFTLTRPMEAEATLGAAWHREGSTVAVDIGKVRLRAGKRPLAVATPHLSFTVVDARVLVDVHVAHTAVFVESGEVM